MWNWLKNVCRNIILGSDAVPAVSAGPMPARPVVAPKAPSKGIIFDPELIPRLKDDHRVLLRTYGSIKVAATEGEWEAVETQLIQIRKGLTDHLMTESIKLYVYLQLSLAGEPEKVRLMRKFSSEMAGIGKAALDFIDKNRDVSLHADKQAVFLEAWGGIGHVLGDRIAREEQTLYPMYDAHDVHDVTVA